MYRIIDRFIQQFKFNKFLGKIHTEKENTSLLPIRYISLFSIENLKNIYLANNKYKMSSFILRQNVSED